VGSASLKTLEDYCIIPPPPHREDMWFDLTIVFTNSIFEKYIHVEISRAKCFEIYNCTMPKRQAIVIFPEVNYELSLGMENVKRESWRQSISLPKILLVLIIMYTACGHQMQAVELVVSHLQSWKANHNYSCDLASYIW
jgi:hypothetical protein